METPKIFEKEYQFCLFLQENEPIRSGELAKLSAEKLGWKTTTTYTVIKRLSERGVVRNENRIMTSLVSREDVQAVEIDAFVTEKFAGSLSAFLAAIPKRQKLSPDTLDKLQAMIDEARKEGSET